MLVDGHWQLRVVKVAGAGLLVIAAFALFGSAATPKAAARGAALRYCEVGVVLQAGVCRTRYFMPGMRVRVPSGGWQGGEDSPLEFKLYPPGQALNDKSPAIRFFLDPRASTPCTDVLLPVSMTTPSRVLHWMRGNKNMIVSAGQPLTIAGGVAATSVDLNVRPTAPRCDPACPNACFDYFLFKAPGAEQKPYGSGPGELIRLYFARIGPPSHVLMVGTDIGTPRNKNLFASLNATAAKILATLRLPGALPPKRP